MTDLERFTALLTDFGVKYQTENRDRMLFVDVHVNRPRHAGQENPKFEGFIGVYAAFTADGTFESMGTDE